MVRIAWEAIEAYSGPLVDDNYGGITSPALVERVGGFATCHTSYTGRISWEVSAFGTVRLNITRPADLFIRRARHAQTGGSSSEGILVARIDFINDTPEVFDLGPDPDYLIHTSSPDDRRSHMVYNDLLQDDLLFERHVWPLVDLVAALLAPHDAGDPRRSVLGAAQEMLAPLFAKALPDPWEKSWDRGQGKPRPETYWKRDGWWGDSTVIVHRGEEFPAETEMTATYAVLLLRSQPQLSVVEAVKAAIQAATYRPPTGIGL